MNFENFDERTLPTYLQSDIKNFVTSVNSPDKKDWDLWWCELYGSINSAKHGREISKELADFLRAKYLKE